MPRPKSVAEPKIIELMGAINIHSKVAVYQQIENCVRYGVAAGLLSEGNQLPSVRELSEKLDINPNTVAKAYRDLEVMGVVYTRRGMGVFIEKGIANRCKKDATAEVLDRLYEVSREAVACGLDDKTIARAVKEFSAGSGHPYAPAPKFKV